MSLHEHTRPGPTRTSQQKHGNFGIYYSHTDRVGGTKGHYGPLPLPTISPYAGVAGVWKPWDWAAGVLIAGEAGAVISAGDGGKFGLMGDTILGAATAELGSRLASLTSS